jgi:ATP-dependent RNA helicase DHX37/DHR1
MTASGMLSRIVPLRRRMFKEQHVQPGYDPSSPASVFPLKLIIMSATLRTSDFTGNAKLFPIPPPLINVSYALAVSVLIPYHHYHLFS